MSVEVDQVVILSHAVEGDDRRAGVSSGFAEVDVLAASRVGSHNAVEELLVFVVSGEGSPQVQVVYVLGVPFQDSSGLQRLQSRSKFDLDGRVEFG